MSFSSPSSDFVLLASTDASASSSVSFDGYFSSTYKNYIVYASTIINATSGAFLSVRLRRSNADVTASNHWIASGGDYVDYAGGSDAARTCTSNANHFRLGANLTNTASYASNYEIFIPNPLNTNSYKNIRFISEGSANDSSPWTFYHQDGAGRLLDNTNALSGITFYFSSGNITSGNFKLYGIK